MRIMIKGGVWKNTEDEILKAAVMKYGKNQWARISSLLVRKSAKQCKARWYEWLDPSIKKTEWTREEDEKLLHLAKLMPTQWRTIAPIVGRTPSQCLERYEKLLDAACSKDENYEGSEDPRKLRPGEIDPNPESKPARPDPVDMDEDEKEMLSEARARLANTRGKKAKRKAREKQLEEARRLASLQKRRELKAAGIGQSKRKRKRRGIDYNLEIPFEKRAPAGFYDVSGEDRVGENPRFPTTIQELEGKRRADVESQLRKQDVAKNKIQQRQDAPSAIIQANKLNDPESVRKRAKLMLPPPQISNQELEEIAKIGYNDDLALANEDATPGGSATRALLGNYSQRGNLMTPQRTPQRTPAGKGDAIMMEAENLARLRESQTPLLGGENPELHPSDFSGVTPKRKEVQTPNPIATPGATPRLGMTPLREGGMTPKMTPFRDELRINEDLEGLEAKRRKEEVKRSLKRLPLPQNEYEIVVQLPPEEEEEEREEREEDMADILSKERELERKKEEALLKKRSEVLQREELPRPPSQSVEIIRGLIAKMHEKRSSFVPPTVLEQADEMVHREMADLLERDNVKYPLEERSEKKRREKKKVKVPELEDFEEDELKEAGEMIKKEKEFLRVAMGHESDPFDSFLKAHSACEEDLAFFPQTNNYGLVSVAGNTDKLGLYMHEFEIVKGRMDEEAKRAGKLEQKVKVLTLGYQNRAGKLWPQIESTHKKIKNLSTELECFKELQKQEGMAAGFRVKNLLEEVERQKVLEAALQRQYGDLLGESQRVRGVLEEYIRNYQNAPAGENEVVMGEENYEIAPENNENVTGDESKGGGNDENAPEDENKDSENVEVKVEMEVEKGEDTETAPGVNVEVEAVEKSEDAETAPGDDAEVKAVKTENNTETAPEDNLEN